VSLEIAPNFDLAGALGKRRLATGDPDSVPAGKYARAALTSLGVWDDVADRLIRAENVRSALSFIARGEAPLGIVYETDALVDKKVRVVDTFPASSHLPIIYPVATTVGAQPSAKAFVTWLQGDAAQAVFKKFGFSTLH
jgi:molybdate transport system substrate-binding protein